MRDHDEILVEAEYWKQVLNDVQENLNELVKLNELTADLVGTSALLIGSAIGSPPAVSKALEEVLDIVEKAQALIKPLVERVESTSVLAEGRYKMLRREAGLDPDE